MVHNINITYPHIYSLTLFKIYCNTEIKLFKKDERGNKEYIGILKEFNDKEITIQTNEEVILERKDIAQIKTIYNWDN